MKRKYLIPIEILFELRSFLHGRRTEIAQKADMHYNSVSDVLKKGHYHERILKVIIDLLTEDSADLEAIKLAEKVGKLIKSKKTVPQAA